MPGFNLSFLINNSCRYFKVPIRLSTSFVVIILNDNKLIIVGLPAANMPPNAKREISYVYSFDAHHVQDFYHK